MPNQLKIIRAPILSLVKDPSNKRWFYAKKEKNMEDFRERLENIFPEQDVDDEDLEATLKESVEVLEEWDEDLPDDVRKATSFLIRTEVEEDESDEKEDTSIEHLTLAVKELSKKIEALEEDVEKDEEEDEEKEVDEEEVDEEKEEEEVDEEKEEADEEDNTDEFDLSEENAKQIVSAVKDSVVEVLDKGE